jgi:hypothetical protein
MHANVPWRHAMADSRVHEEVALRAKDKVLECSEWLTRAVCWRRSGEPTVFTRGGLDLLHVGHISAGFPLSTENVLAFHHSGSSW